MSARYLGIDIGGTAARWVVVDGAGTEIARGAAPGATGHLFAAAERERFALALEAIAAGCGDVAAVQAGITGLGTQMQSEAQQLLAAQFGVAATAVAVSDDMELAYRACFAPGTGHLVAAGTGSIGLHITAGGEAVRVGGRGILIDDGGSGSWIALRALDRLYRQIDESGTPGAAAGLAEALFAAIGGRSWDDVRSFVYGSDRGRIGTLAQAVAAAASAGDSVAAGVLEDAARELARLARALLRRCGERPVAFVGGVLALHSAIAVGLKTALPDTELRYPRIDAALHAAEMAREILARS
ncbi:MAG TPA: BadF/BadG/BcrA/BcrD ATPase family protein [Devosiaceae bacterium]|jgi:N-acetylglucosamine kinase-like BadF-type ATPase|nr:BadF/BadG/BcrA/BcrD ATPase family protein [Devosiaceae bacterium]